MNSKEFLENLIHEFNFDNLELFFRSKSRTFKVIKENILTDKDCFTDGIKFGEFTTNDTNAHELAVYCFKANKSLTERSGKKAQYDLAKKILKQEQRYAAGFFIFYDENGNFRFSLIYDIPKPNGKREWSNFKRFTYYVSKDQTNKTFIYRLDSADFTSFEKIKEAFSVEKVTKEFYTEIANWYFWALKFVKFPKDAEAEKNGKNIALIRFITRIIFIWFMKQKKLIKNNLFDKNELKNILGSLNDEENTYYKAILQNLFFATLNTPIKERKFRKDHSFQGKNDHYMEHNYYRFHSLFNNPDDMLSIFKDIPFLNGGLFECLDKSKNDPSNDTGAEIRIDGFSDKEANQTIFPNFLFFSGDKEVDLNKDYGTATKEYKTRGLLYILQSYNFTIDENTPTDEEIALDPELLGRVFENLLASYNPETATTARKATGSYYTPREIVDYMVDESLIAYLKNKMIEGARSYIELGEQQSDMFGNSARKGQLLIEEELVPSRWIDKEDALEIELRKLISYSEEEIIFTDKEIDILINAINRSKILDPAVGSGAFPMGVLHKLVLILSKLDPHNNKWKQQQIDAIETNITDPKLKRQLIEKIEDNFNRNELDYGRKLYLIQNCLYGVDIQPIAIQIAKLRFFISLLVDEKVVETQDITSQSNVNDTYGIEPLPNLETKLVAANTLIGLPESLTLKPREIEQLEKELFDLRRKYFITSSETEKKQLEAKDRELRGKIKTELEEKGFPAEFAEKISGWNPYNTNIASGWFNPEWMFGPDVKDGFNVVIGNPPYIQLQKAFVDKLKYADLYKQQSFETFERTGDIYCLFYENGIKLLSEQGLLCYITSNKWMRAGYGESLRKFFLKFNPKILIDLGPNVFENATVDTNILLISKEKNQNELKAVAVNEAKKDGIDFNLSLSQKAVTLKKLTENAWFIGSDAEQNLKEKIERIGKPLKDWDVKIYYGIKTGLNEAFIIDSRKRDEILANCKDEAERKRTETIIKPILRGRDIKRYYYQWAELWVIGTFPSLHLNINDYPALKKFFSEHFDIQQLEQSGKKYPHLGFDARKKTGNKWFETQDQIAYYTEFEKEKIIYPNMTKYLPFVYDDKRMFTNQKCFILTSSTNSMKYLVAYLNSKISSKWIKENCPELQGGTRELSWIIFQNIPIPPISSANKPIVRQIESLVDKILAAKKQDKNAETSAWEKEIDELVYKLYDLTEEEIKIIQGNE